MKHKQRNHHWLLQRPIAHRGLYCNPNIPENSMPAFTKAIELGYPIELDIRFTLDKQIIVFHDKDLSRLCDNEGQISKLTYQQIASHKLFHTQEKIPLLKDVLGLIGGRVPLLIELKVENFTGEMEDQVMALLINYQGDFALQSFHPLSIRYLKKKYPNILCGLLSGNYDCFKVQKGLAFLLKNLFVVPYLKPDFISYEYSALKDISISLLRQFTKIPIITWTIDNEEKRNNLHSLCQNYIFEQIEP